MSSTQATANLFTPFILGSLELQHRVVLAPLTRMKAGVNHAPINPMVKNYYSQRSSVPGTLVITEATAIAAKAGGWRNGPGIWSDEQIAAWKEVVDGIHANGSFAIMQLFAMGRAAYEEALLADSPDPSDPYTVVAPSAIPLSSSPEVTPRELSVAEIEEYVELFGRAAVNAIQKAGFDGVELHAANGYLLDQFLSDKSNQRSDQYGGSVENRARLTLEVLDRVTQLIGEAKVSLRLSPWSPFQGMFFHLPDVVLEPDAMICRCPHGRPSPNIHYLVNTIKERHPDLLYLHLIEPRISGNDVFSDPAAQSHSNQFIRQIWAPRPIVSAGGYTRESALQRTERDGELVAFGRWFISNPDLPTRLQHDLPLAQYNRDTFYKAGDSEDAEVEYSDYPTAAAALKESLAVKVSREVPVEFGGRASI